MMSEAEIRASLMERDALRREMGLPPLDIEKEVKQARTNAAITEDGKCRQALRDRYAREREDIREAVIAEMRSNGNATFPNDWSGHYLLQTVVEKRFAEFLETVSRDQSPSI